LYSIRIFFALIYQQDFPQIKSKEKETKSKVGNVNALNKKIELSDDTSKSSKKKMQEGETETGTCLEQLEIA
jgi:hypothetical protein